MTAFLTHKNISIINAILPKQTSTDCIESVFALGDQNTLLHHARGTLVRDSWYHSILPVLSPEKDFLQFLVPDKEVDFIMEQIIKNGHLYLPGAGAVFSIPCEEVTHTQDFHLWEKLDSHATEDPDTKSNLRDNLSMISCIIPEDITEVVSRAALQSGAHGPVIHYCSGRGLRDRLGWLRITRKFQKEVLTIIADKNDADLIVEAMVEAGRIDMPGRGFIYRMPVQKGLINIASTYGNRHYGANMKQVVDAIDNLMGGGHWRQQNVIQHSGSTKSAGLSLYGKIKHRPSLENQTALTCIVGLKHLETIMNTAFEAGARGANYNSAKFIEVKCKKTATGIRLNREDAVIRFIQDTEVSNKISQAIQTVTLENNISSVCLYKQPVTKAITYMTKDKIKKADNTLLA